MALASGSGVAGSQPVAPYTGPGAAVPSYPSTPTDTPVSTGDLVNSPIPGVSGYEGADALAMNAYNNALARINQQRMSTLQQFGYTGQIDPTTGTITGIAVNPNNPYGNLQMMLRNAALQAQSDQQAAQERGLRGGLANQAISADKFDFGNQSQQLGTDLENQLSDLQGQQSDAAYTRDSALWNAEQQAAEGAINNGQYDTPSYADVPIPDYGNTGAEPQTAVNTRGKVVPPPKLRKTVGASTATRRVRIIQQQTARRKGRRR